MKSGVYDGAFSFFQLSQEVSLERTAQNTLKLYPFQHKCLVYCIKEAVAVASNDMKRKKPAVV